mgnify:CR=1 FL=1
MFLKQLKFKNYKKACNFLLKPYIIIIWKLYSIKTIIKLLTAKLNLLKTFLPEQLTEEQIATKLKEAGITSDTSMGEAMKIAKSLLDGQADGATLSKVVKQLITK